MAGMLQGMEGLNDREKHAVLAQLTEMQMQESMNTYNNLVERCFNECVVSFRSKTIDQQENECVRRCVSKFMSFSARVGQRFQEKQQQMAQG
mmetsp:Transcript_20940/g.55863  ORF Transcript_20940/g.55863 Transcript_20940/m.55863 type:complete len:92 (-) Transcript_20940:77-352(-)|eukprot:CAMPEP_0194504628 /NCGR_PEP_ID=MMETSP0253-20130528/29056_1 /TAXON_ID=2966 /ORGANISM="Noctiluca scintillans" /LENGTH=91 /DNA_ID=CAMNT_0039347045 /DNA_START=51 /DNA_END=323 /DNA_ORIENTATION=+